MSVFDPNTFMQTQYNQSTDSKYIPVPAKEYTGQINDIKVRTGIGDNNATCMEVYWEPLDETAKQVTGQDHPQVRQTVWLDLTPENALDMGKGKNIQLGKLREALKQNGPTPWNPLMMKGGMAKIVVEHSPAKDGSGDVYANVTRVASL